MSEEMSYYSPGTPEYKLKEKAFEYLIQNPGSEFGDWQMGLITNYPTEIVEALGNNPTEVYADLSDIWEQEYTDPKTDIRLKICEWAMAFANEYSVGIYRRLAVRPSDL